jgi:L-ribulose-5-phosphate 3-epimerase
VKIGTIARFSTVAEAEDKFRELSEYGFEQCQISYRGDISDLSAAKEIRAVADRYNIEISAMFVSYGDADTVWDNYYGFLTAGINVESYRVRRVDKVRSSLPFVKALGITDAVIHAGFIPNNPFCPSYALMKTSVRFIAMDCQKLGLNLLFETGGESPVAFLRLFTDLGFDNLYINLDPANMLMYGYANPVDAIYTIGKYVRNIHGKDGLPPTDPVKLGAETPIGEGKVDFYAMFRELKKVGYDRYVTIEREISGPQQKQDILKAKAYFEKLLSEVY